MKRSNSTFKKRLIAGCAVIFCLLLSSLALKTPGVGAGSNRVMDELLSSQVAETIPADAATKGSWSQVFPTRDVPIHISVLPNGKLLYWARDKVDLVDNSNSTNASPRTPDGTPDWDDQGKCKTYIWDPLYPDENNIASDFKTNYMQQANTTTNLFCSGHSFLQDGTLFVSGGHRRHPDSQILIAEGVGEDDLNLFDYKTRAWSLLTVAGNPNMPILMTHGRWYPYNLTLSNGETIIMSGSYLNGTSAATATWKRNSTPDILGLDGTLRQSAYDDPAPGNGNLDGEYKATYPRIFLAPDGQVFYTGAPSNDWYTRFLNTETGVWSQRANNLFFNHIVGSGVMYAPGKVLMVAGKRNVTDEPDDIVETYDTTAANAVWTPAASLINARAHMTATLLPDGKVLAVGGTKCHGTNEIKWNLNQEINNELPPCVDGEVLKPELWNGQTWTEMAPHQEIRVYHSTSILLPDGRVLVGGGGLPVAGGEYVGGLLCYGETNTSTFTCRNAGHKNFEIFSPPYLFETDPQSGLVREARRPVIVSAPESLAYGQTFTVGVGDANPATEIESVVLMHLPSVTHGFDQDQRRVILQSVPTADGKGLTVTAPPDGKACPPGPYMMYMIRNNSSHTPSVAKIIRVGSFSIDHWNESFNFEEVRSASNEILIPLTGKISVKAPSGQAWTATVNGAASWVTISSGASGSGDGFINYTVSPNATTKRRDATISIKPTGSRFGSMVFSLYQAAKFQDISYPANADSQSYLISKVFARGVTIGCGDGTRYCPGDLVSRKQMALFLARVLGFKAQTSATSPAGDINVDAFNPTPQPNSSMFADISAGDPQLAAIEFIRRKHITEGCATNPLRYCPDKLITRAEMSALIIRAMGMTKPIKPDVPTFKDVPYNYWAYEFIEQMYKWGITSGCGVDPVDGKLRFCPESNVDRQQMATFLSRAFKF